MEESMHTPDDQPTVANEPSADNPNDAVASERAVTARLFAQARQLFVRWILVFVVLVGVCLLIDDHYFVRSVDNGHEPAGLTPDQWAQARSVGGATQQEFATDVRFSVSETREPIEVLVAAMDQQMTIALEVIGPGNTLLVSRERLLLPRTAPGVAGKATWVTVVAVIKQPGEHTVRLIQGEPGRISVQVYQGIHLLRLLLLPLFSLGMAVFLLPRRQSPHFAKGKPQVLPIL